MNYLKRDEELDEREDSIPKMDIAAKRNIEAYVECIKYGLKKMEENDEFHALFIKAGQYFNVRKKDTYEKILAQVKESLITEAEQEAIDAKKTRILVLDGNSEPSRKFANRLQVALGTSNYLVELRDASKAYANAEDLLEHPAAITIVDPMSSGGSEVLDLLKSEKNVIYAFAPSRESKAVLKELELGIPTCGADISDISLLVNQIRDRTRLKQPTDPQAESRKMFEEPKKSYT